MIPRRENLREWLWIWNFSMKDQIVNFGKVKDYSVNWPNWEMGAFNDKLG